MNFLRRAWSRFLSRLISASMANGAEMFFRSYGKPPDTSYSSLVRKFWGWTYACAVVSANRVASTPLRVYASRARGEGRIRNFATRPVPKSEAMRLRAQIKGVEHVQGAEDFVELEEHPLISLLQNVNEFENGFELLELTSIMQDLTGNAYWHVESDKAGVPTKIFLLRSQWMRIVPDVKQFVVGYRYGVETADNSGVFLPANEVIHFKYPNPADPWYGMGPVEAALYTIEGMQLREQFMIATLKNMARPDLIVKYLEGELDRAERQALEAEWNAALRGPMNAGRVKVSDHRYEIEKIGWSPQELKFNEGEEWIMKKICAAFPVPVGLIDTTQISRAPRSGMEGADLFMAQFNTLPRCVRIEQKLNEQLCPRYDARLFVAFDNPVPKDRAAQLQEDKIKLETFQMTINEIRKREGEAPVPWGDVPLVPANIAPLGDATSAEALNGREQRMILNDKAVKYSLGDGSTGGASRAVKGEHAVLEVDGGYVHESLRGVPLVVRRRRRGTDFIDGEARDMAGRGYLHADASTTDAGLLAQVFGEAQ